MFFAILGSKETNILDVDLTESADLGQKFNLENKSSNITDETIDDNEDDQTSPSSKEDHNLKSSKQSDNNGKFKCSFVFKKITN